MISLDPQGPVAPYEQIRAQMADLIRSGALSAGHRLPSIRQLAADLRIAPGTVAKTYRALEDEGLIVSGRRRGTTVAAGVTQPDRVQRAAEDFLDRAGEISLEEALSAVRSAWSARHGEAD